MPDDLQEKREAVHNMLEPMYFNSEDEFQRYWSWFQVQYETQGAGTRTKSDFQQRASARCRCRRDATRRDRGAEGHSKKSQARQHTRLSGDTCNRSVVQVKDG